MHNQVPFDQYAYQQYAQTNTEQYSYYNDVQVAQQSQTFQNTIISAEPQPQQAYVTLNEPIVRWSWLLYPTNRLDGARMVVPLGCMYTPLAKPYRELVYQPVMCTVCGGILNPYCFLDMSTRTWSCPFCLGKNNLPPFYAQINEHNLPIELGAGSETVEYVLLDPKRQPPVFALVVDTCLDTEDEMGGLKEFLLLALSKIPEDAFVCLIIFGATVQVYDLTGESEYPRSVVLRGSHETTEESFEKIFLKTEKYCAPLKMCSSVITFLIESLSCDLWPVAKAHRPLRCTGAALSAAANLLKKVAPGRGSCMLAFLSGVCTVGPGMVVDTNRELMIRGHSDIHENNATAAHWSSSCAFYDSLMRRIVAQGHALNCFTASLDQLGIAEMKLCIQASGGVVLNAESWRQEPFRISLDQFFAHRLSDNILSMGFNATFDVITSPSWKVLGVIGQCVGTGKKSNSIGDYEIGFGGTCQWTTCMLDCYSTLAVYFDAASGSSSALKQPMRYVQFITRYEQGREVRLRVATLAHRQQVNPPVQDMIAAFDQEAAVALLARQAIFKTDSMPIFDVLRWLDSTVVRLVSRFGDYVKGREDSLRLPQEFVYFPTFIYHLRRSGYLQVFNSSPDESAILRLQLLKSSTADSIVQIQPTLFSYNLNTPPQPVPLDSAAIQRDNILLLDTFFEVLVHYGAAVAEWKSAGYAEMEEYAYFRDFINAPLIDAEAIVRSRYPTPRLIAVCQDDPDARILLNRINPSRSYTSAGKNEYGSQEGELVYTDDASLQVFMNHLKKLAVTQ